MIRSDASLQPRDLLPIEAGSSGFKAKEDATMEAVNLAFMRFSFSLSRKSYSERHCLVSIRASPYSTGARLRSFALV